MAQTIDRDSLSFGDALFLYLERDGMPLNVASVSIFDGHIPLERCAAFVDAKLPLVPRYRQRVVAPPLNIGLPYWDYDPAFDLRNHVREVKLRRGTEAEFKTVAAKILSANMDRTRPLWDLTLVTGLAGNRTGMVLRLHHCLADGISGVGLLNVLMDTTPNAVDVPRKKRLRAPQPAAPPSLLDSLLTASFTAVQQVLSAHSELVTMGEHIAQLAKLPEPAAAARQEGAATPPAASLDELTRMSLGLASPVQRLPFNVVCRGPQKFNWAQISLPDIKAVKQLCGATVNDVALTVVTAAVRRYCELHGVETKARELRIVVPVSLHAGDDARRLGNRITFLPVTLPLGIRDLRKLIAVVHQAMEALKTTQVGSLVGFAGTLIGAIPAPVQALLGPIASQLPLSVCNLICTNVRGPAEPLYLLGHKMLACYPYVPIGGEMGMNCAILTYNDVAHFGFTADTHAAPDVHRFDKLLARSFAELQKMFGIRQPRPARPKPQPEAAHAVAAGAA